jgi:WD40 repeat protein/serine/threonine protein kinase
MDESSLQPVSSSIDATVLDSSMSPAERANEPVTVRDDESRGSALATGQKVRYFGEYELLAEIARGGMGVVYRARQVRLNRIVALKMILSGQFAGKADVQRFHTEAEAAAQLDHPGIVPVYEVGEHDGHHFFTMGFVDGGSLSSRLLEGPLAPREAALLVEQIATAVQYAHEHGVIHRDLKPANVLLDRNGQPRITDFGLAKNTHNDSGLTASGQVMGTPGYMPPEQAAGNASQVKEVADVYSIGAILYALLTGRPPFQADNVMDTLMQVIERDPVAPSALNARVPRDLETICLKCVEKDRRRRYGSAGELAEELKRYLAGMPILARPVGRMERTWRWCRRNPAVASLLVMVTLSLAGGTIISSLFAIEARDRADGEQQNRREAEKQAGLANTQLNRAEWLLYANDIASAQREGELNNPAAAIRSLDRTFANRRGWEYYYLRQQNQQSLRLSIPAHDQKVLALAVSNDGRMIVSAGRDRRVKVWDATSGRELATLAGDQFVTQLTFSQDRQRIGGVATDGKLRIWDSSTGQVQNEIITSAIPALAAASASFLPSGDLIVTNNKDGSVKLWEISTGAEHGLFSVPASAVASAIAVSPNGQFVACGALAANRQSEIRLYDLKDTSKASSTTLIDGHVIALAFDQSTQQLAVSTYDPSSATNGRVHLFDVAELQASKGAAKLLFSIRARNVGFSVDSRQLFTFGMDGVLSLFDAASGTAVRSFHSRSSPDQAIALTPDAELFVSGNDAGLLELWNTSTHQPPLEMPLNEWGYSVAFSPDGRRVATGSSKVVSIWNSVTGDKVIEIPAHSGTVHTVAFHPDGDKVLSGSWDSTLRMWDVASGKELSFFGGGTRDYDSVAISPGGDLFATGTGFTAEIKLFNARIGTPVATLIGATERTGVVAFAADSMHLVSGGESGEVIVWDVANRTKRWSDRLGKGAIRSVAVSADNRWVAALSQSGAISLWKNQDGNEVFTIEEPGLYCIRFTPDSHRLVGGGADASLKFWSVDTGQMVCTMAGHKGRVYSMAFSPDGRRLATTGDAGAVFLRDAGMPLPATINNPSQPHQ